MHAEKGYDPLFVPPLEKRGVIPSFEGPGKRCSGFDEKTGTQKSGTPLAADHVDHDCGSRWPRRLQSVAAVERGLQRPGPRGRRLLVARWDAEAKRARS